MSTANHISRFAYVPQPFFKAGDCTVELISGWDSVQSPENIFDPKLSKFATFWSDTAGTQTDGTHVFKITFDYDLYGHLRTNEIQTPFTVALIGCSLTNYPGESGDPNTPDLTKPSDERFNYIIETSGLVTSGADSGKGFAFASNNNVSGFCNSNMPGIISGGNVNLIVSGLGRFHPNGTAEVTVTLDSWFMGSRHLKLEVGTLFVGAEINVNLNPDSFEWSARVNNDRAKTRDEGAISGDGTIVRTATGEVQQSDLWVVSGGEVRTRQQNGYNNNMVARHMYMNANFFDLMKANTSYPVLFNPFPLDAVDGDLTVDQFKLSARQNFFSIYGNLENGISVQNAQFRDGLSSKYRTRFRVEETR